MKNLVFAATTPPETVLSRFEVCRTQDIEEATQWGERIFCANRLRSMSSKGAVNTSIYYRRLGGIGIGRMSYAHWLSTNDKRLQGESWLLGFWSGMNAADGAPSSDVGHGKRTG